jgi:hypothetical protein
MSRSISQAPHPGELGKAPTTFLAKKPHDKPNGFLPSSDVSDKTSDDRANSIQEQIARTARA